MRLHWEKFNKLNDTFKQVIEILVDWHFSTDILTTMAHYLCQNTCWNVSVYWDSNDSLKNVAYVAEFFSVWRPFIAACSKVSKRQKKGRTKNETKLSFGMRQKMKGSHFKGKCKKWKNIFTCEGISFQRKGRKVQKISSFFSVNLSLFMWNYVCTNKNINISNSYLKNIEYFFLLMSLISCKTMYLWKIQYSSLLFLCRNLNLT